MNQQPLNVPDTITTLADRVFGATVRYNTTLSGFEEFEHGAWRPIDTKRFLRYASHALNALVAYVLDSSQAENTDEALAWIVLRASEMLIVSLL